MIDKIIEIYQVYYIDNIGVHNKSFSTDLDNHAKQNAINCYNFSSDKCEYISLSVTVFIEHDDKIETRIDKILLEKWNKHE